MGKWFALHNIYYVTNLRNKNAAHCNTVDCTINQAKHTYFYYCLYKG